MELTRSFVFLLQEFACVFTAPTVRTFVSLVTGWCLSFRHRYVTELIQSSGSTHNGHHSCYHRFFSHAAWCLDQLCQVLAQLLVATFAPAGFIALAVDDTLCRKRGLTIYGTGMHHDPLLSSRALKLVSWGHDWVVLCLLVRCPFWSPTKVWALPIALRLYRNRQGVTKGKKSNKHKKSDQKAAPPPGHRTRPELAVELIRLLASWFPNRQILVSGDSAYGGQSVLRQLPANVDLISHVHPKGALYEPAPPRSAKQKGRGRKKGQRLATMAQWANDATPWKELVFNQFGLHATLQVKSRQALYYKAGGTRLLTILLVHDPIGKRPDQIFYCSRLDWDTMSETMKPKDNQAVQQVGANVNDRVGNSGVTALSNGNYVVRSQEWNGNRGAVTWGNGMAGVTGALAASSSLVGANANDRVGNGGVTALSNGNYVVRSQEWNGYRGAVTWGNGTAGVTGTVATSNSLVGGNSNDQVGTGGVIALSNGNYVVLSSFWNGFRGAATWGDGTAGVADEVAANNSLVGANSGDGVGERATALSNGNYVVASPSWNGSRGAATWANGTNGITGTIDASNCLVGTNSGARVSFGFNGVIALNNGNYAVRSPGWNGNRGAATWGDGTVGITGEVNENNSLVG